MIRLNLGCAANMFADWTNTDHVDMSGYLETLRDGDINPDWPEHQRHLSELVRADRVTFTLGDMRHPLPHDDASVDAIYLGQCVEHFNPLYELPRIFAECYRVLKPRGVLRITTPDLGLLFEARLDGHLDRFASEQPEWYASMPPDLQLSMLMYGSGGPESTNERYEGHHVCFSRASLSWMLHRAGFTRADAPVTFFREAGQTEYPELFAETRDYGASHSIICEVAK